VAELPSGTVTFLFTDIEGSTRLWEEHPDAMRHALERHDEILRDAVESHGGYVVKTMGDGFHAAFSTADTGAMSAITAQLALDRETWGATGRLRARMGLHTGSATLRDGDYYGPSLNRAARLMSVAHGGQIVCSQATADLARDALPETVGLLDLGEHRLRDLSRAERVYQIAAAGLDREFPALRSLDAFPGNLPAQTTSFVGRVDEQASVAAALDDARLVTLTGVGGVGKTRLAIHAAAEVLPSYPEGAWLCELAAAGDPDAMLQVVAAALGVQAQPDQPLDARLREALRERRVLVVLDNCEHLLNSVSRLADGLLRDCPSVRILATSREPLDVGGERVVRVRSLSVPDEGELVDRGDETDAMRLFVERARSAEPDFVLRSGEGETVAELCRRLDGIPLAIELAAARVVAMRPSEILDLIDERFRLLTGGRRTAVERHQTLRATVDWSYSLLSPTEQLVFERLGVFPATFDAAAARAVAEGDGVEGWDVVDALTGLVNKSMVNTVAAPTGVTRYQLLETMRQYARERLDQSGSADDRRRAHAEHYAELSETVSHAFQTGHEVDRMWSRSKLELDNYRAAVTWALDSDTPGDADIALRIATRLAGLPPADRRVAGLIANADRLLERAEASSPELHAGVLAGMSSDALFVRGDPESAEKLARRALAQGPTAGGALATVYGTLCLCAQIDGDADRAVRIIVDGNQAMKILGFATDHHEAFVESLLAGVELSRGDVAAARTHADESVRYARLAQLPMRLAQALVVYARAHADEPAIADEALGEVIAMAPDTVGAMMRGFALQVRVELRTARRDTPGALVALRESLEGYGEDVPAFSVIRIAADAAIVLERSGETDVAAVLAGAARQGHLGRLLPFILGDLLESFTATVEEMRRTLGDDVFAGLAARGAAMPMDEIVRFVRRAVDDALAEKGA